MSVVAVAVAVAAVAVGLAVRGMGGVVWVAGEAAATGEMSAL